MKRPLTGDTPTDSFLDSAKPYTFRYKDPGDGLSSDPSKNGGHFLGVMAQNLESDRSGLGRQIVTDTPHGKQLEMKPLVSALTGAAGRMHRRIDMLEHGHVGLQHAMKNHLKAMHNRVSESEQMVMRLHDILRQRLGPGSRM